MGNFYVHYHYINYLRFGINGPNEQKGSYNTTPHDILQKKREELLAKVKKRQGALTDTQVGEYEKIYNDLLNPIYANSVNKQVLMAGNEALDTLLKEEYHQDISSSKLFTESGSGSFTDEQKMQMKINEGLKIKNKVIKQYRLSAEYNYHQAQTISNSLKELYKIANNFIKTAGDGNLTANKIKSQIQQIDATLQNISDKLENISQKRTKNALLQRYLPKKISHDHVLIEQINTLVELLLSPSLAGLNGDIGEYTAIIADIIINKNLLLAKENIKEEIIKEAKKIQNTTVTGKASENSLSITSLKSLGSMFNIDEGDLMSHITENSRGDGNSQNKIDVIFHNKENKKTSGISVKNYNLSNNYYLKMVSQTPFSNILNEEPEFAAHYLNIVASRTKIEEGKSKYYSFTNKMNSIPSEDKPYSQYFIEANNTLKILALLPAMGGFTGRNKADYILVNDNSKTGGGVKLLSINEVIREILNRDTRKAISLKIDGKNINALTRKHLWKNEWVGDDNGPNIKNAQHRIAFLIAQTHASKVTVAISPDVFYKLMYNKSKFAK